jgi:hypothetical protein
MKICSRCQKTYSDETLNFCLDDGAVLTQLPAGGDAIPATVLMSHPRPTNPNQPFGDSSTAPNNWNNPNQFSMPPPPPKKSKSWLWALGIIGGLMILCGGGFVGFIFWAASFENTNKNFNSNYAYNTNVKGTPTPSKTNTQEIDLSKWVHGDTDIGVTEFKNGDFLMSSKKKGYYYVLAAPGEYKTENATTKVTVRNINEADSALGFGLIVHSNPIPLTQDYAFLIDSEDKKYRVVRHVPQDEIKVVDWTYSSAIKDGTQENVLEVRDQNKKMNFYINGELVKTVNNTDGYSGGVAGIYSGDAVQIAFTDLEISK